MDGMGVGFPTSANRPSCLTGMRHRDAVQGCVTGMRYRDQGLGIGGGVVWLAGLSGFFGKLC